MRAKDGVSSAACTVGIPLRRTDGLRERRPGKGSCPGGMLQEGEGPGRLSGSGRRPGGASARPSSSAERQEEGDGTGLPPPRALSAARRPLPGPGGCGKVLLLPVPCPEHSACVGRPSRARDIPALGALLGTRSHRPAPSSASLASPRPAAPAPCPAPGPAGSGAVPVARAVAEVGSGRNDSLLSPSRGSLGKGPVSFLLDGWASSDWVRSRAKGRREQGAAGTRGARRKPPRWALLSRPGTHASPGRSGAAL